VNQIEITDVATQFHDGVFFIVLAGTLANFFVPFKRYALVPQTINQKVRCKLCFI
jgi:parvin